MRWLAAAVLVAVSGVLIVWAADGALLREGITELARSPALVAALVAGYAAAFALRGLAWHALLDGIEGRPGVGRLFAILHAALFANHALPVKAGEVLRPALAARAGAPLAEATVSTVVARMLDMAALLAIAAALLPLTATGGETPMCFRSRRSCLLRRRGRCSGSVTRPSSGASRRPSTASGPRLATRCGPCRRARCSGRSC